MVAELIDTTLLLMGVTLASSFLFMFGAVVLKIVITFSIWVMNIGSKE